MKHIAFFGDGEHVFALPFNLTRELEKATGVGIGALIQRVHSHHFHLRDLTETLRLALIGGGMSPKEAADLVKLYAAERPISEFIPVVLGILDTVWFGTPANSQDETRQPSGDAPTAEVAATPNLAERVADAYADVPNA